MSDQWRKRRLLQVLIQLGRSVIAFVAGLIAFLGLFLPLTIGVVALDPDDANSYNLHNTREIAFAFIQIGIPALAGGFVIALVGGVAKQIHSGVFAVAVFLFGFAFLIRDSEIPTVALLNAGLWGAMAFAGGLLGVAITRKSRA